MFFVDKYYNNNYDLYHYQIINSLLNNFDNHNVIYNNFSNLKKKENVKDIIQYLNLNSYKYSNLPHLTFYGQEGSDKNFIVNKLIEKIYGAKGSKLQEIEYIINGYSNQKTKVMIKQSNYHIVIEPNNNGFDKYLVQDIIQEYAKTQMLNISKDMKLFKIVIINTIDNLSYYAQTSLRRTMEKYANTCKFIFICNQLSKMIEPLKSRCLLVRIPSPTKEQIFNTILHVSIEEKIVLSIKNVKNIIDNCDNNINKAIWFLELIKNNIFEFNNWKKLIDKIIENILMEKTKNLNQIIENCREYIYTLFITNINLKLIMRDIMKKLISKTTNIKLKHQIIDLTSEYEYRMNKGTRFITHIEAYILKIINLFYTDKNKYI